MKFDTRNRNPLAEGGEGCIYEYNGKIIKVFKSHIDLKTKEHKVDSLIKQALPQCVIKPIDKVLDNSGRFIGYIMNKAAGEEFKRLTNKKFCAANNIDTRFVLGLLVKVKTAIEELHRQNIFIGDLNDQNILFNTAGNIFFLDCDSWAVGGEKCTVAMDLFKDPKLKEDNFNENTDNYAFMVLAWKSLTRVHPFGGTMQPDVPITERISNGISVIDRPDVKIPKTVKAWNGISPILLNDFKQTFENGQRNLTDSMEDMLKHILSCKKCEEWYYDKFSLCPYCDSTAKINQKPQLQGIIGGLKLVAVYDGENINTMFDRYTYLDNDGLVIHGNIKTAYQTGVRYHFLDNMKMVEDMDAHFIIYSDKEYRIEKKYRVPIVVDENQIYYVSPSNVYMKVEVLEKGNAIKSICRTSNNVYFSVEDDDYCIVNYYYGKLIVNINGTNTEIEYDSDIQNYGLHRDSMSGKWLMILENRKGIFVTYILKGNAVEYRTDQIKYECSLGNPCISNSTIFIPIDGKIRGFSYKKSAFKDFECGVVSEESNLEKEKNRFVIVNSENVYYLGK